jgi:hypothetical protein
VGDETTLDTIATARGLDSAEDDTDDAKCAENPLKPCERVDGVETATCALERGEPTITVQGDVVGIEPGLDSGTGREPEDPCDGEAVGICTGDQARRLINANDGRIYVQDKVGEHAREDEAGRPAPEEERIRGREKESPDRAKEDVVRPAEQRAGTLEDGRKRGGDTKLDDSKDGEQAEDDWSASIRLASQSILWSPHLGGDDESSPQWPWTDRWWW